MKPAIAGRNSPRRRRYEEYLDGAERLARTWNSGVGRSPGVRTEVFIYCAMDGCCTLNVEMKGERHSRKFEDLIEAVSYVQSLPEIEGTQITILDWKGDVSLRAFV